MILDEKSRVVPIGENKNGNQNIHYWIAAAIVTPDTDPIAGDCSRAEPCRVATERRCRTRDTARQARGCAAR